MTDPAPRFDWKARWVQVTLLVITYVVVSRFLMKISRLPTSSYEEAWIGLEFLKNLGRHWWAVVGLLLTAVLLALRWRSLLVKWSSFSHGGAMRTLVLTAAALLAWTYSTYGSNYYHDRWHALDRILLAALVVPLWIRPIFVFPFLAAFAPIPSQMGLAPAWLSWVPVDLPLNLLFLFAAFLLLALAFRWTACTSFLFLALCIFGAQYWFSGFEKLKFGWLWHDQVYFLLPSTYAGGWLGFLSPEAVGSLTQRLAPFNGILRWFTIFAECAAPLLLFFGKRTAVLALGSWILLHTAIFGASGIFFWQWMACCLCLGALLWGSQWHQAAVPSSGRPHHILAGVILVLASPLWVRTNPLAWIDTNIKYVSHYEGVGESGQVYALPPRFFKPFEYSFTLHRGTYLTEQPAFSVPATSAAWELEQQLRKVTTAEELLALEREFGVNKFNPKKRERLIEFLQRFVGNLNADRGSRKSLGILAAPPLLWRSVPENIYRGEEPLRRIEVTEELWFFDGITPRRARTTPSVLSVPIGAP